RDEGPEDALVPPGRVPIPERVAPGPRPAGWSGRTFGPRPSSRRGADEGGRRPGPAGRSDLLPPRAAAERSRSDPPRAPWPRDRRHRTWACVSRPDPGHPEGDEGWDHRGHDDPDPSGPGEPARLRH